MVVPARSLQPPDSLPQPYRNLPRAYRLANKYTKTNEKSLPAPYRHLTAVYRTPYRGLPQTWSRAVCNMKKLKHPEQWPALQPPLDKQPCQHNSADDDSDDDGDDSDDDGTQMIQLKNLT